MFPQVDLDVDLSDSQVVSNLYDQLIKDYTQPDFLNHKFVFLPLPSHFANQQLCLDEPVRPLNIQLLDEYMHVHQSWKSTHRKCKRCDLKKFPVFDIVDNVVLTLESSVQFLPAFISKQFLFENEPCNVPPTVEEFYETYVSEGTVSFNESSDQELFRLYHRNLLEREYPRAVHEWKMTMSKEKLSRFENYDAERSTKTVVKTTVRAAKAKPISM